MDLGDIIRESWGVYKRNFLTLVIPFLILATVISVVFSFIGTGSVTNYLIGYLAFFLSLTFCCSMAIGTTQQAMLKKRVKLGDILRIGVWSYPEVLATTLIIAIPLMGFLYLLLSYSWGIILITLIFLYLCFCPYAWQGIVIRSLSPWSSIRSSFKVAWQNLGTTFVLCLLFVLVWFLIGPAIPIVGTIIVYLFLPLWVVVLSVTYMDRTGELLRIFKKSLDSHTH